MPNSKMDIPNDVVHEVSRYMHWINHISLSFVCKSWSITFTPSVIQSKHFNHWWLSVNSAACGLELLRWLTDNLHLSLCTGTLRSAIQCGDLDTIRFVHDRIDGDTLPKFALPLLLNYHHRLDLIPSLVRGLKPLAHPIPGINARLPLDRTEYSRFIDLAISKGDITALTGISDAFMFFDYKTVIAMADIHRQEKVLRWLHERNIVEKECRFIGGWADVDTLTWALDAGFVVEYEVAAAAALQGRLDIVKFAIQRSLPPSYAFQKAARGGHMHIMLYLSSELDVDGQLEGALLDSMEGNQLMAFSHIILMRRMNAEAFNLWTTALQCGSVELLERLDESFPIAELNEEAQQNLLSLNLTTVGTLEWLRNHIKMDDWIFWIRHFLPITPLVASTVRWVVESGYRHRSSELQDQLERRMKDVRTKMLGADYDDENTLREGLAIIDIVEEACSCASVFKTFGLALTHTRRMHLQALFGQNAIPTWRCWTFLSPAVVAVPPSTWWVLDLLEKEGDKKSPSSIDPYLDLPSVGGCFRPNAHIANMFSALRPAHNLRLSQHQVRFNSTARRASNVNTDGNRLPRSTWNTKDRRLYSTDKSHEENSNKNDTNDTRNEPLRKQRGVPSRGRRILGWAGALTVLGAAALGGMAIYREFADRYYTEDPSKKTVVILGSGWASMSVVKDLDVSKYNVIVISPRNYFLFTPLLPSTTVGTVDTRSIVEPVRAYCRRLGARSARYYEAEATDIDFENKKIYCEVKDISGLKHGDGKFDLSYDYLVVGVGSVNNTFGTKGVEENCNFLKEIDDATRIRERIGDVFETASLPGISPEEKKKLLSFLVVGGGPTGVEFAAELSDFLHTDVARWYSELIPYVNIKLVHSPDHLLNTYDAKISEFTEKKFKDTKIDVLVGSRVLEVRPGEVEVYDKSTKSKYVLPFSLCVWSTGISPAPLVSKLAPKIKEQVHSKLLMTDKYLRLLGTDHVFALGDCSTVVQPKLMDRFMDLFKRADRDGDGTLSKAEFTTVITQLAPEYPQLSLYADKIGRIFEEVDKDGDSRVSEEEFRELFKQADMKLKSLPATAQVASQQGKYLAKLLNSGSCEDWETFKGPSFKYNHRGSFAYVGGNSSVAEIGGKAFGGFLTWWLWRGVYLSEQVSLRNKVLVASNWAQTFFFGRDISRF
ncbi:putative NADH-ubiquinone oxidoreductase C3A11.07, mitochondrial-like [Planoprotostelium fungivorum]|uniref:NADH:ubiquinone reductase (non-electrogenic) n=1 Tax=Planoprotostelium fungivorum TaxID=1890364 RepID=A0A2P6NLI2_9EUKA|nr:putative NADH-ubiquinone oxidoreductase C3A11.07, mitochondrial-like [Planoprotostelium fungivorum]